MFEASIYLNRRKALIEEVDNGILLFLGTTESPRNYVDNTYRFRQDSTFLYYFGWKKANMAAIIDLDEGKTILFAPAPTMDSLIWTGPQPSLESMGTSVGITETAPIEQLAAYLDTAKKSNRFIHYLPPYRAANGLRLSGLLNLPYNLIKDKASTIFTQAVIAQRSIKSDEEVDQMDQAVNISRAMHIAAMKAARPGVKEHFLVGIIEGISVSAGGELAYSPILTVNGQTLHNHYHHNILESGQLILGDFGAETSMNYSGDITRTFPVSSTFSNQQKEIYQIVLLTLGEAINSLSPGSRYLDIHLQAAKTIAYGLSSIGLMKGDVEEAVHLGAHALFFPHGLGHMIGLDVHDMEDLGEDWVGYSDDLKRSSQFGLKSLRLAKYLEAGYALTVEPGIYFIPELIDQWRSENKFADFINYDMLETYKDFGGIRLEDNVLITENGHRMIGQPIPKSIEEVEMLRKG